MTSRPWLEPPETPIPDALATAVGGHPLIAQALAQRGLTAPQAALAFLDPSRYKPLPPETLPGVEEAAHRLEAAIRNGEHILVWGDFDVDGQTATALLVEALTGLGGLVSYHIPVRAQESHGISADVLRSLLSPPSAPFDDSLHPPCSRDGSSRPSPASDNAPHAVEPHGVRPTPSPFQGEGRGEGQSSASPRLLLTCDTGIAAFDAVLLARSLGLDVIITDHHALPPDLPAANIIVTPRFLPGDHPLSALPGVGVAYKLVEALYRRFDRQADCARFLDLVALGIVADVARLTGETRYLLQRGLQALRQTPRPGLQAIYERAGLDPAFLTEEHIGFVIAPRLNALGRLGDANPAVELLTTADMSRARLLALQLEGLNARRQLLTGQVLAGALSQIETDPSLLESLVLVLSHPAWEAGVVGIVASRLVELFGKPAILIAAPPGEVGRGSARSVEGLDITAAIASQAGLLLGFGGHAMAAGFSIDPQRIPDFRRGLNRYLSARPSAPLHLEPLRIDGYLPWADLSLDLAADLERLAPFGPGNPPLALASHDLRLVSQAALGRDQAHLLLTVEDAAGLSHRVIWWNGADFVAADSAAAESAAGELAFDTTAANPEPSGSSAGNSPLARPAPAPTSSSALPQGRFDLAYTLRATAYRGNRELQLEWLGFRPLEPPPEAPAARRLEIVDYRTQEHPLPLLRRLLDDVLTSPPQRSSPPPPSQAGESPHVFTPGGWMPGAFTLDEGVPGISMPGAGIPSYSEDEATPDKEPGQEIPAPSASPLQRASSYQPGLSPSGEPTPGGETPGASPVPLLIWAEADARQKLTARLGPSAPLRLRHELTPCQTLVIWTTPASPADLQAALERARPRRVILFAVDPAFDQPQAFLQRLAGLVKHNLSAQGGRLSLSTLAAATGQRISTVQRALEWLAAQGVIYFEVDTAGVDTLPDTAMIFAGGQPDPQRAAQALQQVRDLLEETRAYRAHFSRADTIGGLHV